MNAAPGVPNGKPGVEGRHSIRARAVGASRSALARLALTCLVSLAVSSRASGAEDADRLFALRVFPLLRERCFGCHGEDPKGPKGELDLRTREGLLAGGESGAPTIVANEPGKSLLLQVVRREEPAPAMPPKENDRLAEREIEWIERWVRAGAPWPDEARRTEILLGERQVPENEDGVLVRTSGGLGDDWTYRRYPKEGLWALRPLERPPVPAGDSTHPIDAFLDARLAKLGLDAAPPADARTLLRRVSFDLIGLPPTPEESERFLADWKDDPDRAWGALVDRLLESPHHGERWAQHWLDVVRYADTAGFSNDYERSNAWRYRDYIVRSFNADKPFDRMILEQIAGDELAPDDPEAIVATGFLRMGPWGTAMVPQEEARQIFLDDVVHSVGQSFLSMPLRCARCHDHKFDPIPTRDYYRIYSAFAATQPAEMPAPFLPEENLEGTDEGRALVAELLRLADTDRLRVVEKQEAAARRWYDEHELPYKDENARKNDPEDQKPPRHVGLDPVDEGTLKVREQDVWIWTRRLERYEPLAQSVYNGPNKWMDDRKLRPAEKIDRSWRPVNHVHLGGSRDAKGPEVSPGVLSFCGVEVDGAPEDDPWALPQSLDGRRLELARWIADSRNPLSTRSIVNRLWQHHFGQGLVRTANNFGIKGDAPSHPELLDWLASELVANGWRLKPLHRLIVSSAAYRRSTAHPDPARLERLDPDSRLLAKFTPRLLSAEEIRDGLLAVSGELNRTLGGYPVRPEINREVAFEPRMIQFSIAPAYVSSRTPQERNRRTIYAYRVRGQANPFLEVLHRPTPNESCEHRERSAVTPQAFTLLNSETMMDRAIAFALRLESISQEGEARLDAAFRLALGRAPSSSETRQLLRYLEDMESYHERSTPAAVEYPLEITRSLVEEFSGQPFDYTEWLPGHRDYVLDAKPWTVSASTRALADVCLVLFNSNEFVYVY